MRNFLKNLSITAVAIFTIVSFIRWDINIGYWDNSGRFIYVVAVLFVTCLATALQEESNN